MELINNLFNQLQVPTFQVIVGQGLADQVPWQAMSFTTLWLEILGFCHLRVVLLVGLLSVGNMAGSLFGGLLGDVAATHLPNTGRIMCFQFSTFVGIPLSAILLFGLPKNASFTYAYATVLFAMGFLMSWNSPATNWPIFAEIVSMRLYTTMYLVDHMIERSLALGAMPLVGILAQRLFGYNSNSSSNKLNNATALGKGLLMLIVCPFFVCLSVINILYRTFSKDRDRARSKER